MILRDGKTHNYLSLNISAFAWTLLSQFLNHARCLGYRNRIVKPIPQDSELGEKITRFALRRAPIVEY